MRQTVTAVATATLTLYEQVTIEYEEGASAQEIEKLFLEEAHFFFDAEVSLANGMSLDIGISDIDTGEVIYPDIESLCSDTSKE